MDSPVSPKDENLVSTRVPSHLNWPLHSIPRAQDIAFPRTLAPTGIRSPDHRARSEPLYQLSFPGPHRKHCITLKLGEYSGACVVFHGLTLTQVLWPLDPRCGRYFIDFNRFISHTSVPNTDTLTLTRVLWPLKHRYGRYFIDFNRFIPYTSIPNTDTLTQVLWPLKHRYGRYFIDFDRFISYTSIPNTDTLTLTQVSWSLKQIWSLFYRF